MLSSIDAKRSSSFINHANGYGPNWCMIWRQHCCFYDMPEKFTFESNLHFFPCEKTKKIKANQRTGLIIQKILCEHTPNRFNRSNLPSILHNGPIDYYYFRARILYY